MNKRNMILAFGIILSIGVMHLSAENIDPYDEQAKFGWSENGGWLNLAPDIGSGMQVNRNHVTGFIWSENMGWISLSCTNTNSCDNVPFGVTIDANGHLHGFAWSENTGWIKFDPEVPGDGEEYGVFIDEDGLFHGHAWGENIGWIRFDRTRIHNARVCIVQMEDLVHFAQMWLAEGDNPADLNRDGNVNHKDYVGIVHFWQDFCPDGWELK